MIDGRSLITDAGTSAFEGLVRGADEMGHFVLSVNLVGLSKLYGEFRKSFQAENDVRFSIEICTLGYYSKYNVGNPHPDARARLSPSQIDAAASLIVSLFSLTPDAMPWGPQQKNFTGEIVFSPGWVRA